LLSFLRLPSQFLNKLILTRSHWNFNTLLLVNQIWRTEDETVLHLRFRVYCCLSLECSWIATSASIFKIWPSLCLYSTCIRYKIESWVLRNPLQLWRITSYSNIKHFMVVIFLSPIFFFVCVWDIPDDEQTRPKHVVQKHNK